MLARDHLAPSWLHRMFARRNGAASIGERLDISR